MIGKAKEIKTKFVSDYQKKGIEIDDSINRFISMLHPDVEIISIQIIAVTDGEEHGQSAIIIYKEVTQ